MYLIHVQILYVLLYPADMWMFFKHGTIKSFGTSNFYFIFRQISYRLADLMTSLLPSWSFLICFFRMYLKLLRNCTYFACIFLCSIFSWRVLPWLESNSCSQYWKYFILCFSIYSDLEMNFPCANSIKMHAKFKLTHFLVNT